MAGVLVRQARSQKGSTSSLCTGIQQVGGAIISSLGDIDYMTGYITIRWVSLSIIERRCYRIIHANNLHFSAAQAFEMSFE